jgi:hypothetical protein
VTLLVPMNALFHYIDGWEVLPPDCPAQYLQIGSGESDTGGYELSMAVSSQTAVVDFAVAHHLRAYSRHP